MIDFFKDVDFENETVRHRELDRTGLDPDFIELSIPITGYYLDSIFANEETLKKRKFDKKVIGLFNPPRFNAGEQRALYGIFKIYAKRGFSLQTFADGIFTTPYELCEVMEYKRDSYGKFGKWHREEALENISALAKKTVDFYKREYKGLNKEKKRIFDIWVLKDRKILDYGYKAIKNEAVERQ